MRKYDDGITEAKVGDVVRCVYASGSTLYCDEVYTITHLDGDLLKVTGQDIRDSFMAHRFQLIRRQQEETMTDPKPEPLVKWPEERQKTYAELRPHELFVFVDHPQVVLRRLERCGSVVVFGADQFDSYEPAVYASDRKIRRVKVLAMPQFEVI